MVNSAAIKADENDVNSIVKNNIEILIHLCKSLQNSYKEPNYKMHLLDGYQNLKQFLEDIHDILHVYDNMIEILYFFYCISTKNMTNRTPFKKGN